MATITDQGAMREAYERDANWNALPAHEKEWRDAVHWPVWQKAWVAAKDHAATE
jgi:hypothetical protein